MRVLVPGYKDIRSGVDPGYEGIRDTRVLGLGYESISSRVRGIRSGV